MSKRKICVITGTRAEFGLLKPVMEKIRESDTLELQIIVTGMHLVPEYGETINEIKKSGFSINAKSPMIVGGDDKQSMAISIGLGIISITQALDSLNPDIVLVLGDRYEILAATISATYSGKIVAHLFGGDSPQAGYDEYSRHAITKLSHIHFPTTKTSADRIIKLGEDPRHVFQVGSTALDTIMHKKLPSANMLSKKYHINFKNKTVLLIYHPVSTSPEAAGDEIKIILESLILKNFQTLIIYPNSDPGGQKIITIIEEFQQTYPNLLQTFKSIPFEDYLGLMKMVSVMVGNSSSGIMEAPSFFIPVINIGDRQKGRERACNIIDTAPTKDNILLALDKALHDEEFIKIVKNCKSPYGDGTASKKIVNILADIELNKDLLNKKITY